MRLIPSLVALLLSGPALAQQALPTLALGVACADLTTMGGASANAPGLLPMASWAQRPFQLGYGGLSGTISLRSGVSAKLPALCAFDAMRARHRPSDATSPDLAAFAASVGTLILWHALADPHLAPANTRTSHREAGTATGQGFNRLSVLAGMAHCSGGRGPSQLDLLMPMLAWVEPGAAPAAIRTAITAEGSTFGLADAGGSDLCAPHTPETCA